MPMKDKKCPQCGEAFTRILERNESMDDVRLEVQCKNRHQWTVVVTDDPPTGEPRYDI